MNFKRSEWNGGDAAIGAAATGGGILGAVGGHRAGRELIPHARGAHLASLTPAQQAAKLGLTGADAVIPHFQPTGMLGPVKKWFLDKVVLRGQPWEQSIERAALANAAGEHTLSGLMSRPGAVKVTGAVLGLGAGALAAGGLAGGILHARRNRDRRQQLTAPPDYPYGGYQEPAPAYSYPETMEYAEPPEAAAPKQSSFTGFRKASFLGAFAMSHETTAFNILFPLEKRSFEDESMGRAGLVGGLAGVGGAGALGAGGYFAGNLLDRARQGISGTKRNFGALANMRNGTGPNAEALASKAEILAQQAKYDASKATSAKIHALAGRLNKHKLGIGLGAGALGAAALGVPLGLSAYSND